MAITAAAITAGAGLVGSAGSAFGQSQMNLANRQWSAQQAALQRDWAAQQQLQAEQYNTQMSDTAMQRRVADLKAAGLNPMLAVGGPGASTPQMGAPSGASAQNPNTGNVGAAFQGLGQTAASAVDAYKAGTEARLAGLQADLLSSKLPYAGQQAQQETQNLRLMGNQIKQDGDLIAKKWDLTDAQVVGQMQSNQLQLELIPWLVKAQQYETQARQYGLPSLAADSDFMTKYGNLVVGLQKLGLPASQIFGNVAGGVGDLVGPLINALTNLTPLGQAGKVGTTINRVFGPMINNARIPTLQPPMR